MNIVMRTLFGLHFFNDAIRTTIVALLPFIAKEFGMSLTQVGVIGSAQGLMAIFTAIPGGLLAARIGGIKMLFLMMTIYIGCLVLIGVTPNLIVLIAAYFLAAIGFGPFHIVGQALAARFSNKNNLGKNLSNFTVIGESGRVIMPAIALSVTAAYGWRITILGSALLCIISFIVLGIMWKKSKEKQNEKLNKPNEESSKEWLTQLFLLTKQKKLLLVNAIGFLDNIGGNAIYVFLPFLLLAKGVHAEQLGLFVGTFFLGTFTGKVVLGRAVDRLGNVTVLFVSELLMALFLVLLALSHWFVVYFILSLFLGIFTRGTTPVVATLFTETTHAAHYEKVYAVSEIFFGIAASLSAILMGFVADHFGITNAFLMAACVAASVVVPIIGYARTK